LPATLLRVIPQSFAAVPKNRYPHLPAGLPSEVAVMSGYRFSPSLDRPVWYPEEYLYTSIAPDVSLELPCAYVNTGLPSSVTGAMV